MSLKWMSAPAPPARRVRRRGRHAPGRGRHPRWPPASPIGVDPRRLPRRRRRRACPGLHGAAHRRAPADRPVARLRRPGRGPGGRRRVLPAPAQARGTARLRHGGPRAGDPCWASSPSPAASWPRANCRRCCPQRPVTYPGQNVLNLALFVLARAWRAAGAASPGRGCRLVPDLRWPGPGLRRAAHHAHRRRRHADRDLHPELLRRPFGRGHGLRAQQQAPDHGRRPGRLVRPDPLHHHVQGHEPVVHQRAVRRLRPGPDRRGRRRSRGYAAPAPKKPPRNLAGRSRW